LLATIATVITARPDEAGATAASRDNLDTSVSTSSLSTLVTFDHGAARLAGTLHRPTRGGRVPAVVMVHGSGPATRQNWPVRWCDALASAGIASFVFDKPGAGESTGDWRKQSFEDRARESLTAVDVVARQAGITNLALMGASQGGWVVPIAAALRPNLAAAVCLSAPGVSPTEQDEYMVTHYLPHLGFNSETVRVALEVVHRRTARFDEGASDDALLEAERQYHTEAWFKLLGGSSVAELAFLRRADRFDPVPYIERTTCPVLGVWGASDLLVPTDTSVQIFRSALQRAGNKRVDLHVLPSVGHGLEVVDDAGVDTGIDAPGLLDLLADWLRSTLD
jgi:pimeloyl-ACP methyl ester carboxylesterase